MSVIEKLRNPCIKSHEDLMNQENEKIAESIEQEAATQLNNYEKQHKEFVDLSNNQISSLQTSNNFIQPPTIWWTATLYPI